ncbi:NUDIX hydrolase [Desulfobacterota bacterium AH_259_B03_O07]|nr:NUDIX hydrolase [Desulfobacterota bacterium AH_259_B03_O07]
MIKKWNIVKSEKLNSYRVFATRKDIGLSPITGKEHDFYVIEAPIWINVIGITQDDQILLIKQYRHGIRSITFEIPGGMADPGESPLEAAKRELLEETGCISDEWIFIGKVHPNPAIQNNSCFTYLANNITKIQKPKLDGTEDIDSLLFPVEDIKQLVSEGKITHSLVIAALYWYLLYQDS